MRKTDLLAAATVTAAVLAAPAARADEAEIMSHYDAYSAAMGELRYLDAMTEAEAAWRAAEQEWGGIEDTGVLAFNLVRLRLMADQRAQALEPAQRLKELVDGGQVTSIKPEEAELFVTMARFDSEHPARGENRELRRALQDFQPTDYISNRIDWMGWSYLAKADYDLQRWRDALEAAEKAGPMMAEDPTAPLLMVATVAIAGARAGYEEDDIAAGLRAAHRGIAAFPPQPVEQPLHPLLLSLLVLEQGLNQVYGMEERQPFVDPDFADPMWDDGRYAASHGCTLQWRDQPSAAPGGGRFGGRAPATFGTVFEFYLDDDGSVTRINDLMAAPDDEPNRFAETLASWTAEPPTSAECHGPYHMVNAFMAPPGGFGGGR